MTIMDRLRKSKLPTKVRMTVKKRVEMAIMRNRVPTMDRRSLNKLILSLSGFYIVVSLIILLSILFNNIIELSIYLILLSKVAVGFFSIFGIAP